MCNVQIDSQFFRIGAEKCVQERKDPIEVGREVVFTKEVGRLWEPAPQKWSDISPRISGGIIGNTVG